MLSQAPTKSGFGEFVAVLFKEECSDCGKKGERDRPIGYQFGTHDLVFSNGKAASYEVS